MNASSMTPAQIDALWLPLMERIDQQERWIAMERKTIADPDTSEYAFERAGKSLAKHWYELDELSSQAAPFAEQWDKRGGWVRYYLVQNGDGHYHRSRSCSTCFATTQFVINPMTSGLNERELVDLVGTDACTTCFPFAPSTHAFQSGASLGKAEKDARRDAKTTARIEKATKKVAFWEKQLSSLRAKMVTLGGDPDFTGEPVDVFLVHPHETRTPEETQRYYRGSDIVEARDSLKQARRDLEKAGEPVLPRRIPRAPGLDGETAVSASPRPGPQHDPLACRKPEHVRVVVERRCNFSAFNGYHYTPSAYSLVECRTCGARWRSKARYVDDLPDSISPRAFVAFKEDHP